MAGVLSVMGVALAPVMGVALAPVMGVALKRIAVEVAWDLGAEIERPVASSQWGWDRRVQTQRAGLGIAGWESSALVASLHGQLGGGGGSGGRGVMVRNGITSATVR